MTDRDEQVGPWRSDIDPVERACRVRELRAIAALLAGCEAPITRALHAAAAGEEGALEQALLELDRAPPLVRRRVLSTYSALLMAGAP